MSSLLKQHTGMVKFLPRKLESAVAALTATTPIWETNPEDVFIVGYPKSGHTWLQNLVSGAVYGVDPARTPDRVIQELVPDIYERRFYRRSSTPMFFKSHELPKPEYKRVIYLLRDGRDAIQLERKEDMKRRGLASPDNGDALALTFAYPVLASRRGHRASLFRSEYDPYDYGRIEQEDHVASLRRARGLPTV